MQWLAFSILVGFLCVVAHPAVGLFDRRRTEGGIHLPLRVARRQQARSLRERAGHTDTTAAGLGSYFDVTYSVLLSIGDIETSLTVDTGSSDLWVISDQCTSSTPSCDSASVPLYPQSSFSSTGLDVSLYYGDSTTGTHAFGMIGRDTVSLAGELEVENVYFASINDTNTKVLGTGSAGIFGLGFPINSVLWSETFSNTYASKRRRRRHSNLLAYAHRGMTDLLARRGFPSFDFIRSSFPVLPGHNLSSKRQTTSDFGSISASQWTAIITSSYSTLGPFVPRLVSLGALAAPMFTVTLQRDSVERGGNVGILSIGELPASVENESLTWVDVRRYTADEGGLSAPQDSPSEEYPIAWEVFIDAVYFDGEALLASTLADSSIRASALIDTGNSLIRGPSDVLNAIYTSLGGTTFSCSTPHTLAFQIGGQMFPVDPRDFIIQAYADNIETCIANLAVTDTPVAGHGYLYSWSLGDPFLKGVLSSFYFGNLSHPSQDPPRVGFLSTVPEDAGDQLLNVFSQAKVSGDLYGIAEPAPTAIPPTSVTNSMGVAVVETGAAQTQGQSQSANGALCIATTALSWIGFILATLVCF